MAMKRDIITLALAGIGALTGLVSLSFIVCEKIEYRPRVEITRPSFVERQNGSSPPGFTAYVRYKNRGKVVMDVYEPPLLVVRDSAGKRFGPFLMQPAWPSDLKSRLAASRAGLPSVTVGLPRVSIAPLRSEGREYSVPALERAITKGEIADFHARWRDFTFEVEVVDTENENYTEQSVIRQSFDYKSFDGHCLYSIWCTGKSSAEDDES